MIFRHSFWLGQFFCDQNNKVREKMQDNKNIMSVWELSQKLYKFVVQILLSKKYNC
jgi:hypothetical protein